MSHTLKEWLELLGTIPAPILQTTVQKIKTLINSPTSNYLSLAPVIQQDTGFSLQVLRAVNLNLSDNRDPIVDVAQAIPLLGMTWLETKISRLPQVEKKYPEVVQRGLYDCYSRAQYASQYAAYWARLRNDPEPNELATAALLEHISEIMLWLHDPDIAQKAAVLPSYGLERNKSSRLFLRSTIEDLNISLIQRWNLPRIMPSARQRGIALAYGVSKASTQGWHSKDFLNIMQQATKHVNKESGTVASGLHRVAAETARALQDYTLPTPVPEMLYIPTPKLEEEAKAETSSTNESSSEIHQKDTGLPTNTTLQELISRTMQEMHSTAGLQRTAFLMLNQEKTQLQTIIVQEINHSNINKFTIDASSSNLFGLLLKQPHAIWVHQETLKKYAQLIPKKAINTLNTQDFFIQSIFSGKKPIGLMFADNGSDGGKLDATSYDGFQRLCQRIVNGL